LFVFSSVLQIPGESTLRRNFQQIQEGEGRRTPNPLAQRRVQPPPEEPRRGDNGHAPRDHHQKNLPRGDDRHHHPLPQEDPNRARNRPDDERRRPQPPHDDRPRVREDHRSREDRQSRPDDPRRHHDAAPRGDYREPIGNHHHAGASPNLAGAPVRPSPPRVDPRQEVPGVAAYRHHGEQLRERPVPPPAAVNERRDEFGRQLVDERQRAVYRAPLPVSGAGNQRQSHPVQGSKCFIFFVV